MPGSSLWLVPPDDSELYKAIHDLIINHIPPIYPGTTVPHFTPHITLTSNIDLSLGEQSDAQNWLDKIHLPDTTHLKVAIKQAEVGSPFFKKITMRCEKMPELCELAAACRIAGVKGTDAQKAHVWVEEQYLPHCSLM